MKKISVNPQYSFKVLEQTYRSQVAEMILHPGKSTGSKNNKHPNSDQWLYVTSGKGKAIIEGKSVDIESGDLLLIEAGETHEIKNVGDKPLKTFNIYAPPVY